MTRTNNTRQRIYQFGVSTLTLRFGDITEADADVIVSSDDCYISMGGGVSASIRAAGGDAIALDASKKVPVEVGDVVVTTAGSLSAQYVFHAITIGRGRLALPPEKTVKLAIVRCMRLLNDLKLNSIAFPAIGAGVAGFSYESVAAVMAETIEEELLKLEKPAHVTVYLFDRFGRMSELEFLNFFEEFAARVPKFAAHQTVEREYGIGPVKSCQDLISKTQEDLRRERVHHLRRLLAQLEEHRGTLELQLVAGLSNPSQKKGVNIALKSNQELRLQYMTELQSLSSTEANRPLGSGPVWKPQIVFVSSTYIDMQAARAAVRDALLRSDLFFRGMEHFGATPNVMPPAKLIVDEVRKADVYLGIFGMRYGSVDPVTGLSMTELEFREAEAQLKPMLLYVIDTSAEIPVAHIEQNPKSFTKLNELKDHICANHLVYQFKNTEDLARQVYIDLQKLKEGSVKP
jgi:O-acetyl-ADP-ribose deacetylase (regulator of RNase III)